MRPRVHILTGYLGSGKTTLLNDFLSRSSDTAVIVNELGDVAIDDALLAATIEDDIAVLTSGCLCCQVSDNGWQEALQRILELCPRQIVVELSGAADPRPVVHSLQLPPWASILEPGIVVATLDLGRADALCEEELAVAQLESALRIVLTNVDRFPQRLASTKNLIAARFPGAELCCRGEGDPFGPVRGLADEGAQSRWLSPSLSAIGGSPDPKSTSWRAAHAAFTSSVVDLPSPVQLDALQLALRLLVQFDGVRLERIKGVVGTPDGGAWALESVGRLLMPPRALAAEASRFGSRMVVISRKEHRELHAYASQTLRAGATGAPRATPRLF